MVRLSFEYNAKLQPKRSWLRCETSSEANRACQIPGATRPEKGPKDVVKFPVDELILRQIESVFQSDIKIDQDVQLYLNSELQKAKNKAHLKEQEDVSLRHPKSTDLYPFQRVDVSFMIATPRVLNANQMGTGKTIETAGLINEIGAKKVLFVVTKSKMLDWRDELAKWCNDYAQIAKGSRAQKQKIIAEFNRFLIISYGSLVKSKVTPSGQTRGYPELFNIKWDLVVFDEAHRLKGRKTQQADMAGELKTDRILMLTGTPILNQPAEVWSLLNILYPERFTSYWRFVEQFCLTEENFFSPETPNIVGIKNTEQFQYILAPIMLRRLKKDVMPYLPEKIYKTRHLELEGIQARMYKEMKESMMTTLPDGTEVMAGTSLAQVIRLRQICLCPAMFGVDDMGVKTEALLEMLEDITAQDIKMIAFSWSQEYICFLADYLFHNGIKCGVIHGSLSEAQRQRSQDIFKNDPDCHIMLATIGAGGEGYNWQCASVVVFLDKDWVPAKNEQGEDRVHRDGQKVSPLIISFVAKDTIDEHIEDVLQLKEEITEESLAIKKVIEKLLKTH